MLTLYAATASDLMSHEPISIRDSATVRDAVHLLTNKGISAAPVIDAAGRPVGVLSRSDILVHEREGADAASQFADDANDWTNAASRPLATDDALVRDLMTPVVFSVTPLTSVQRVIEDLVSLHVHRLFVVDEGGILVGVISALDVLRHLR
jgi:CBS domain-containing protein